MITGNRDAKQLGYLQSCNDQGKHPTSNFVQYSSKGEQRLACANVG